MIKNNKTVKTTDLGTNVGTALATPTSANLAAAITDETGSGAAVFATSPTLVTPALGTPSALVLTNATGRANASQTADQIATSGSPVVVSSTAPSAGQVLTASSATAAAWQTPSGGPASQISTSGTPVDISSTAPSANQVLKASSATAAVWSSVAIGEVTGLGSNVGTFLGTPSSANLAAALTDETGSGAVVFATSPTLVTPALGTPSALVLTNATGRASSAQTADEIKTSGTAVTLSTTAPSAGQVLTASSATAAGWSTPTSAPYVITPQRIIRPTVNGSAAAYSMTSDRAIFLYLGYCVTSFTPTAITCFQGGAPGSSPVAEFCVATTPSAPTGSGQTLTVVSTAGSVTSLTGTGEKSGTSFSGTVSAGTHIWIGFHYTFASTAPNFGGALSDWSRGEILTQASVGATLSNGSTVTGSLVSSATSVQAPYFILTI